ncbi:MAG TPA: helicase-related protein [Myxococcaceae bacterium]|nr:helicase-related protein [Myxococcaceae bacterium]
MAQLIQGMKVRYLPQPEWGVGHLVALHDDGNKAEVTFPSRTEASTLVSTKGGALVPQALLPGDAVQTRKGRPATVVEEVEGGRGLRRYVIRYESGEDDEMPESEVMAVPPKPDLLTSLKDGRVGDARNFLLRRTALQLDEERRCDALGALLASRVMVKPHQVGVVQRVLSSPRPRFILADEVGLGKTIEAGMIFSALRLSGLANRVLVVAPSHLTVQWLAELFHKFNQLFTLMDGDRYVDSLKEHPDVSPWARHDKVVTSLEMLSRGAEHRSEAGAEGAFWDLVIIDEAHHLKGEKAFAAAKALAKNAWGLLLLTATPMQLDPDEYRGLLTLVDPQTAPSSEAFQARMARQEELSAAVRELLGDGKNGGAALKALAQRFPQDDRLNALKDRDALVAHLAETYSLSDRLIRNRRVVVGGFAERRLHRHPVSPSPAELEARRTALDRIRASGKVRGAVLANLLRRLESSPAAFLEAVNGTQALTSVGDELKLPERDAKYAAFQSVLEQVWAHEPNAKVLVFTEARTTLESLRELLRQNNVEALGYHGDLPLIERDRQVARFRDPDGPKVMICTEVGGEGRNFQFAHHLVNYDLPWSPATMEQRIGRLDRIGQMHPVEIHVFDVRETLSADLLSLLADAVGVFTETVGGLDAVLEEVEPKLLELALLSPEERGAYAAALKARVSAARGQVRQAYDPLLDLRSFDRPGVQALVARAHHRMRLDEEAADGPIEDGLWAVARDLDERMEEAVTELARKVGIGVDTDEQVDAFQCAFHFGHALNVEALPGISIQEEKTRLGTFWRDTAVDLEEIEYFATGHPLVEALFGFLRDGPFGRNGMRLIERRGPLKARGVEFLFHVQAPEAGDTTPGARVPSRQLSRFIDRWLIQVPVSLGADGAARADLSLLSALEGEGQSLKGDEIRTAFPGFDAFVDRAAAAAFEAARLELEAVVARARTAMEAERDASLERTALALGHQGFPPAAIEGRQRSERAHYQAMVEALSALQISLDAACGFIINR